MVSLFDLFMLQDMNNCTAITLISDEAEKFAFLEGPCKGLISY
jgi:hypothetical protein